VPCRVIQCGAGMAGGEALRAIIDRPDLELAGLLVAWAENAGKDAGEAVGRPPTGIKATCSIDEIVAKLPRWRGSPLPSLRA